MEHKTIDDILGESPLTIAEHRRRNWRNAIGVVLSGLIPPILLQADLLRDLGVLAVPAAYGATLLGEVKSFLPSDLPRVDVRFAGWLVMPAFFAWRSTVFELSTDGKLPSTEASHIDHLEHEALLAKQKMRSQNLSDAEADVIERRLRRVDFEKYVARKRFAIRRHQLVAASLMPWLIMAPVVTAIPILVAVAHNKFVNILHWDQLGSVIAAAAVALVTLVHKALRYNEFGDFWAAWELERFSPNPASSKGNQGPAINHT